MKLRPFRVLFFAYAFVILVFGFCILNAEEFTEESEVDNIWNSIWLILVTVNTIGYGDVVPLTFWGRLFLIIACIGGVSIYSIFVLSLQNLTIFNQEGNL